MYQYPYGNAQQLNLDWILNKIQELESGGGGEVDLEEVANALVSASYDPGNSYRKYDYAFYNNKLYRCLNDTTGAWNPSDWTEVPIGDDISILTRLINTAVITDVKFDTSGTNGKLQQKYAASYHDVVEVDYTPVQNSKRPLSSNAGYELNTAINIKSNISLFKQVGIIGDSYACGEQYYDGDHHDLYGLSWGAMLARSSGIDSAIYAKGGQTAAKFLDSSDTYYYNYGYGKILNDFVEHPTGLFIIALGLNDAYTDSSGSNIATFKTNYGTIIDNLNTLYGNAEKIVALTFKRLRITVNSDNAYNTAIIETATAKGIPVIDVRNLPYFNSTAYTNGYDSSSHPTPENYGGMATAIKNAIENKMTEESYFSNYRDETILTSIDRLNSYLQRHQSSAAHYSHTVYVPNGSAHLLLMYAGGLNTYIILFVAATGAGYLGHNEIAKDPNGSTIAYSTNNVTITYPDERTLYVYDFIIWGRTCSIL